MAHQNESKSTKCLTQCFTYFSKKFELMPSVKPVLRVDKIKSNGEAPIYVRVINDRKPKYKSLGLTVLPQYWDDQKEKVKTSHPHSIRFNHLLNEKISKVQEALIESEFEGTTANPLDTLRTRSTGFLDYADEFIKRRTNVNKVGMIRRMGTVVAKVRSYLKNKDIPISSIDVRWLNRYENHLRNDLNNSTNTVASNMSCLRAILNDATREGIIKTGQNPFGLYRIKKAETEIEFLSDSELEAIKNLNLNPSTRISRHRDMYVFACYTAGIRISDLLSMRWKDFDGEKLRFTTSKTSQQLNIKLGNTALELIRTMDNQDDPNAFIFGLLPSDLNLKDAKATHKAISSATAYTNTNLNVIAKKAGLDKHIHFHTSRHTWATRMLRRGMRIEHVSKLLGHRSIRTTQIYAKIVDADLDRSIELFND